MVRQLGFLLIAATIGVCLSPVHSQAQDDDGILDKTGRADAQEADEIHESGEAPSDGASALEETTESPADLDARLVALDAYLADMQRPSRLYWWSWVSVQTVLTGGQLLLGLQAEKGTAERGSNLIGAATSGTSLALLLVGSYPARSASKKFRSMPQDTPEDKEAKALAGENWLIGQAKADTISTSAVRHIAGALVAIGGGLGVALGYEHSVKEAVRRTLTTLMVSELQIVTRPIRSLTYAKQYSSDPHAAPQLAFAPLLDRHAQGISLVGRF